MSGPHRVLACIDERAAAEEVLRTAAQLARERRAELYALHVQAPGASTRCTPQAAAQLARNLQHAADLGAQVEVRPGHHIASTILQFARERAVGWIVVGASQRGGWQRLIRGDIAAQLRAGAGAVEVVVVGG
ncbi:MAG TPA: universal stress protein [Roseiflexaceae bacterium]|nr:universal stress protein [Roseiflexaceae bacterium]